jgi:ANTAR domain/GAF domain
VVERDNVTDAEARATRALALAAAAMVDEHDVIGTLTELLRGSADALGAAAAGLVVREDEPGRLEFLTATSHRVEELELYQLQVDSGPCLDCVRTDDHVFATRLEDVASRWPQLQEAFHRAGFVGVHAAPLHWHGRAIGALNYFWTDDGELGEEAVRLAQTFADVATMAIVNSGFVPVAQVLRRTRAALRERAIIEQAKGVLAYQERLDMAAAFDRLLEMADDHGHDLRVTAADVVRRASHRRRS